jgi:hypothetical protein
MGRLVFLDWRRWMGQAVKEIVLGLLVNDEGLWFLGILNHKLHTLSGCCWIQSDEGENNQPLH